MDAKNEGEKAIEVTPLPGDVPGTLTLDQLRETVNGFGYQLVMIPREPQGQPPGFAPQPRRKK